MKTAPPLMGAPGQIAMSGLDEEDKAGLGVRLQSDLAGSCLFVL
jgi:hypothetical protein